ncbi:hypothetical protein FRB91_003650 [Serendipita sp. 411]|nr:hypothetical protein FRB91_003650 [Serendipita sp. 411]
MSTLPGVSRPGMPSNDGTLNHGYSICTRSRDGIYTVEKRGDKEEQPHRSQCLMVDQAGLITHVGSIDSVKALNPATRIRFLPPKAVVLPGLVDSHVHLLEYGWSRSLNLEGTRNVAQVVERVRNYILSRPSSVGQEEWIEGVGWDQNLWEDWSGGFPTHDILDADPILRGKPIILFRVDLHAMWLSGRALELCGELPEKAEGGEIIRDSDGKPTGVFLDNAQLLVPRPDWSESQMREFFERGTKDLLKWGVTAVHDAMSRDSAVKFYQKMADEGILPLRMHLMGYMDVGYWNGTEAFHHYGVHRRLNLRSVKMVADGAIGSWGAAMYEPYSDNPSTSGFFVVSEQDLKDYIPKYLKDRWQVNVHCIGDRANGEVLDIFENALKGRDIQALRPRIEHAQILRPQDIGRMASLGLIASVQPKHATSDMVYADARLGERVKSSYAYQSFLRAGGRITLGSDMPVESGNPLVTFHAAVTRVDANGGSPQGPGGWYPEEKLTRMQSLKGNKMPVHITLMLKTPTGMTIDAAYASFSEHEVGSLEAGKRADFVVLDRDIMSVDGQEILKIKVLATVVDGVIQFGSF